MSLASLAAILGNLTPWKMLANVLPIRAFGSCLTSLTQPSLIRLSRSPFHHGLCCSYFISSSTVFPFNVFLKQGFQRGPYIIHQQALEVSQRLLKLYASFAQTCLSTCILHGCVTNYPMIEQFKTTSTYYLTVSAGRKSRHGFAGSLCPSPRSNQGISQGSEDPGKGKYMSKFTRDR